MLPRFPQHVATPRALYEPGLEPSSYCVKLDDLQRSWETLKNVVSLPNVGLFSPRDRGAWRAAVLGSQQGVNTTDHTRKASDFLSDCLMKEMPDVYTADPCTVE